MSSCCGTAVSENRDSSGLTHQTEQKMTNQERSISSAATTRIDFAAISAAP